jgi:hypothetical protein
MHSDNRKSIEKILEDLYAIDPAFRDHEQALRSLISKVVAVKPDTRFDRIFAAKLRNELIEYANTPKLVASPFSIFSTFDFRTSIYSSVAGALMAILIVAPLTYFTTQRSAERTQEEQGAKINLKDITASLPLKPEISTKGQNAFGKITVPPLVSGVATSSTKVAATASTLALPAIPKAAYTYHGESLKLEQATGTVYKRTKGVDLGSGVLSALQNANLAPANLSSFNFSRIALHTIDMSEDKADGYSMTINFDEGAISIINKKISENADGTTTLDSGMVIALATTFLSDHSIDRSIYGEPLMSSEGSSTVIFPLVLDGKEVFDEHGKAYGLKVVINAEEKKVASVRNLTFQKYEGSDYALETNSDKLIKDISTVGATGSPSITLDTPKTVLMRYVNNGNELFVPALLFPAAPAAKATTTKTVLTKDAILVPLAKVK